MGGRASHAGSQHQISLQHGDGDAGEDLLNICFINFLYSSLYSETFATSLDDFNFPDKESCFS